MRLHKGTFKGRSLKTRLAGDDYIQKCLALHSKTEKSRNGMSSGIQVLSEPVTPTNIGPQSRQHICVVCMDADVSFSLCQVNSMTRLIRDFSVRCASFTVRTSLRLPSMRTAIDAMSNLSQGRQRIRASLPAVIRFRTFDAKYSTALCIL